MLDMGCIGKHHNLDATTALDNFLISITLDDCNSLVHSIPRVHLNKLQCV